MTQTNLDVLTTSAIRCLIMFSS